VIDCGSVSGSHAEMRRIEGGYELHDLDSTNGIKLDGERRPVIPLQSGLSVKLGDVAFDFQLNDEELEALAREKTPVESPVMPDPEDAPRKKKVVVHPDEPEPTSVERGPIIWFLIFAVIAFCTGMAIRYQKETGGSWIQGVITRVLGDSKAADGGK
jgi:pSer/pThr/pTyr-binding forkhead associated (FHA) protein